jgi:hypothetical protein
MSPDERIEHRIRTNREIEERVAPVLLAKAIGKEKKARRKTKSLMKELHDLLPEKDQAGFRAIVGGYDSIGPVEQMFGIVDTIFNKRTAPAPVTFRTVGR